MPLLRFSDAELEWVKEDLAGNFRRWLATSLYHQDVVREIGLLGWLQLIWGSFMEK